MPPCPRRLVFVGPRAALAWVPPCDPRGVKAARFLEPRVVSTLLEFASRYQARERLRHTQYLALGLMCWALLKAFSFFWKGSKSLFETVGFKTRLCCVDVNSPVQALIKALDFQGRDVA